MQNSKLVNMLIPGNISVSLDNILENSKAGSGGERDLNFLRFLIDEKLLLQSEVSIKRTNINFKEEIYLERYKKMHYESDRHFYCRVIIQDELKKLGIDTFSSADAGNMSILRENSNYDIITDDYSSIIDIGLTPARNYFRGLTEKRVKNYMITTYFDDYMDDIIFCCFTRSDDERFMNAVQEYEEGNKMYVSNPQIQPDDTAFYR